MNHNLRRHASVLRALPFFALSAVTVFSKAQGAHHWTERENLGFKGPAHSARTTVIKPNPDPRSGIMHKLYVDGHPDWKVFDLEARQVEFASSSTGEDIVAISKCTFQADGARLCEETTGQRNESTQQRTTLPDGSREVKYFMNSKLEGRDVSQFDQEGRQVRFQVYGSNGDLSSEEWTLPDGYRSKIYGAGGVVLSDNQTRSSKERDRIERWSYDSDGRLVWNLALSGDGRILSHWYDIGFKPRLSSSDSLGVCSPGFCIDYKFDDKGSGRLEKTVQHIQGVSNLEPDSEEHYDLDGVLDEKAEIKYKRDEHGNWISRSVFVWDFHSNTPVEIERDTRIIEYYN